MKLQILIPHYKALYSTIKRLLVSIAQQQGIDFDNIGVIICNDGLDVLLPENELNEYPYKIQYIIQKHSGVSVARNTCLEAATAEYVMFCDEDDMFIDMLGLWYLWGDIQDPIYDILYSSFIESWKRNEEKELIFTKHDNDNTTFLHGKLFRRQFLLNNNIKFNPSLAAHEDEYFVSLAFGCLESPQKADYFETPFYLWRWNKDSVCRREKNYMLKIYNILSDMYDLLVEEFVNRGNIYLAKYYCGSCFFDIFYTINRPEWLDDKNIEYRKSIEKKFVMFYKKYISLFESIDRDVLFMISSRLRSKAIDMGLDIETIAFPEWLDHIKELSEQLPE